MKDYDRLEAVANEFYSNLNQLAKYLNISSQALYGWKNKEFNFKQLKKIAAIGINPEYIKTGNGQKLLKNYNNVMIVSEPMARYGDKEEENIIPPIDLNILSVNDMRRLYDELSVMAEKIKKILDGIDENM